MATKYKKGDIVTVRYDVVGTTNEIGETPVKSKDGSVYHRRLDDFDVISRVIPIGVNDIIRYKESNNGIYYKVLGVTDKEVWHVQINPLDGTLLTTSTRVGPIHLFEKV